MTTSGIHSTPYIELVHGYTSPSPVAKTEVVQLRDGPPVPTSDRFVRSRTTVAAVVKAEGSLLEWEKKVGELGPGTVVWHPGGSLASHYAVHCMLHDVPIVCSDSPPKIGSVLDPVSGPAPLSGKDLGNLALHIVAYDGLLAQVPRDGDLWGRYVRTAISVLHSQSHWGNEDHLIRLRAFGAAVMVRFASAAIFGELRHWNDVGPGRRGVAITTVLKDIASIGAEGDRRNDVYMMAFSLPIETILPNLATASVDFSDPLWGSRFGGPMWSDCATSAYLFVRKVMEFVVLPSREALWKDVVSAWNILVNIAHNNGKLLTKFVSNEFIDSASVVPVWGLASSTVADIVLGVPPPLPKLGDCVSMFDAWRKAINTPVPRVIRPQIVNDSTTPRFTFYPKRDALYLHVQVPGPPNGRDYGEAFDVLLAEDNRPDFRETADGWGKIPRTLLSMTGSGNIYAPCSVEDNGDGTVTIVVGKLLSVRGVKHPSAE